MFLVDTDKPYLFTPIFPLFIAKSFMHENSNNGNLTLDAAYRFTGLGMVYAEFLLDDLESPSSLVLKNYSQNKWAFMAGATAVRRLGTWDAGLTAEYSRLEPGSTPISRTIPPRPAISTAPSAIPSAPILRRSCCAPMGAAGRASTWASERTGSGRARIRVPASSIPTWGGSHRPKEFLADVESEFTLRPSVAGRLGPLAGGLEGALGSTLGITARMSVHY